MGSQNSATDRGRRRAASQVLELGRELRMARVAAGLSQADAGRGARLSSSQVSRIERGLVRHVRVDAVAALCADVGLGLSIRAFPDGDPIRDAAQDAVLGRFLALLPTGVPCQREVPMPLPGDHRAWDAVVTMHGVQVAVEVETRLVDVQALFRRIALKQRDSGMAVVLLVVAGSRANRGIVRLHEAAIASLFPLPGRAAVEMLRAGSPPPASALILVDRGPLHGDVPRPALRPAQTTDRYGLVEPRRRPGISR